jgi:membrane fusion protein (multidrug efflux system)
MHSKSNCETLRGIIVAEGDISAILVEDTTRSRSRLRTPLLLVAPIVILVGALYFYLSGGRYESTENASLQTGQVGVAPDIDGKVIAIEVHENQRVTKGQVLFRIANDTPLAAVAEAEAKIAAARTEIGSKQQDFRAALSDIEAAQARLVYAQGEASRQRSLLGEGISSRAQSDQALASARTAASGVAAARAKAESLRAELAGSVDGAADRQPAVREATAALQRAQIRLGNTIVRAPQDGIVTRVNQLQVGTYVLTGRPVFVLTGLRFWVQANFKENQLRYMRVGQPATVEIDAFPDHVLKGRVTSFSPGTGSSFSVLPAENATGNWVKVVQRLPVEVTIDQVPAGLPLSAGLSVSVEVDTGHRRHLIGADTPASAPGAGKAGSAPRQ